MYPRTPVWSTTGQWKAIAATIDPCPPYSGSVGTNVITDFSNNADMEILLGINYREINYDAILGIPCGSRASYQGASGWNIIKWKECTIECEAYSLLNQITALYVPCTSITASCAKTLLKRLLGFIKKYKNENNSCRFFGSSVIRCNSGKFFEYYGYAKPQQKGLLCWSYKSTPTSISCI
ncbi:MAG: hypothetical protein LBS07_02435 [Prevotellaceae bacterium]|jgi:DNA modification methylase|nr:hypothetical protein [Prevotellaceae bacterium]